MGNEPSMDLPWQFVYAGNEYAWRTQYWLRWVLQAYWTNRFDGIPGNDDYGTLSAWAVFAYLGLYPIGGTRAYVLASPVFANVTLALPGAGGAAGGSLTVVAHNASAGNIYVSSAAANGVPLASPVVDHGTLLLRGRGGANVLEFTMTDTPAVWGAAADDPRRWDVL